MASKKNKPAEAPPASDVPSQSVDGDKPPSSSKPEPRRNRLLKYFIPGLAIVIFAGNVGLFYYLQTKENNRQEEASALPTPAPSPTSTPTPTPTPYPLPQGKRSWLMSYGDAATGPKIQKVTVDPFDPKLQEKQTFEVDAKHTQPIISVDLALTTDNKTATYSLTRVNGTESQGTWKTTITTDDSHNYNYYAQFILKSAVDESKSGLTFRAY